MFISDLAGENSRVWECRRGVRVQQLYCSYSGLRPKSVEKAANERTILQIALSLHGGFLTRGDDGDGGLIPGLDYTILLPNPLRLQRGRTKFARLYSMSLITLYFWYSR